MPKGAPRILLAGHQSEIATLHPELLAKAGLGELGAGMISHFEEVDYMHVLGQSILYQIFPLRRFGRGVMYMHVPGPPTPRGEINPSLEQQRPLHFANAAHPELLGDRDIFHAVAGPNPVPASGQVDEEIARGLINHRLFPIRYGRPVLIYKATVVVVALALHLAHRTNPVPVGVELDSGDELLDGGGLVTYPPVGRQTNLAGIGVGDATHRGSGLATLSIHQAEMDAGGVGRLGFSPVGAGGATRGRSEERRVGKARR